VLAVAMGYNFAAEIGPEQCCIWDFGIKVTIKTLAKMGQL
jgi:hypothetical protein